MDMHIDQLLPPPQDMMYREVEHGFVEKMLAAPGIKSGFNTTVFPVIPRGRYKVDAPASGFYHTLGGNHMRTCLHQLHAAGKLSVQKQTVPIIIYQ